MRRVPIRRHDSIGGWRPKGFVNLALAKGYKLGFQASSDHISTHQSYANVLATENTREAIVDALRKRHVYASTEQIVADVRSGPYLMGDIFSTDEAPSLHVRTGRHHQICQGGDRERQRICLFHRAGFGDGRILMA